MYSLANASCKANAIATLSPKPRGSHHGDVAPLSETALELLEQARDTWDQKLKIRTPTSWVN